jgi:acyl-CoA synthetase (NDP forming)
MIPPSRIQPIVTARSIAVVGASESPDSWAPEIHRSLQHVGFDGDVYPINPKYREVWGLPCLGSPSELPRGVDLAVLVVPAQVAVMMIDEVAAAGVRGAMVVSSGFAEAGEEGRELQRTLRERALAHRLPVLGPNVEGFVNHVERVAPYGTTPPPEPRPGAVAVLSQSGTVAWQLGQAASDRGVGLRILLGVGNEAVIGLGDMLAWAAADRRTRVVAAYVETMRDVASIGRGLDALAVAGKPVLVCAPAARSEAARRSIVAHTGALAGDTQLRDAWLRARGAILVDDPVALFEAAVLLSHRTRLRTTGVAVALQSGGACTLFAEAAGARGLALPALAGSTRSKLRRALPSFASIDNPLDVTGQAAVETDRYERALAALARDPRVGLVAFDAFPPRLEGEAVWATPVLRRIRDLQRETGVVFASVAMGPLAYDAAAKAWTRRQPVPFLQGHGAAAGAIRALVDLQGARRRRPPSTPHHRNRAAALRLLRGRDGPLDEVRAGRILELYGVRRPRGAVAGGPEDAAAATHGLRFPVAVKALAPELPHKARVGGVRLGLRTPSAVASAAGEVLEAARAAGAGSPRVLVQEMAAGHAVLVGAVVDGSFGPCVTIRPGGELAERGEAAFVACPLSLAEARRYVESQADRCALDRSRHSFSAVARAVTAISRAAHDLRERLTSLEANPLLVGERVATAVDALAEARSPA